MGPQIRIVKSIRTGTRRSPSQAIHAYVYLPGTAKTRHEQDWGEGKGEGMGEDKHGTRTDKDAHATRRRSENCSLFLESRAAVGVLRNTE